MRLVKNTFFNRLFQPRRIGKAIRGRVIKVVCRDQLKRTYMQKIRRAHQGQANQIIGRNAALKRKLRYPHLRSSQSVFVKRAST